MLTRLLVGLLPVLLVGQSSEAIAQLDDVARDVRHHAERLNALGASTPISNWTHTHHLLEIRTLVHAGLRPALARLTALESTPQAAALAQLLASARVLEADLGSAELWEAPGTADKQIVQALLEHSETLLLLTDAATQSLSPLGLQNDGRAVKAELLAQLVNDKPLQ